MILARRKPATRSQQAYQDRARALGCVVCRWLLDHGWHLPSQCGDTHIHHRNGGDHHGQKQLGQDAVVALCAWHHMGTPTPPFQAEQMRDQWGPSFAATPRDFRIWTDDQLPGYGRGTEAWQKLQDEYLEEQ